MEQIKNQRGLSILEVLAALGIMTFVFVGGLEFFRNSYKQQAEEQQGASFYQSLLVFDSYLSDENTCTGIFSQNSELKNYKGGTVTLKAIKRQSGSLFETGTVLNGIKTNSITIAPTAGISTVTSNDNKYYMVDLNITATTNSGKSLDNKKSPFRFVISTNQSGKFLGCARYMPGQAYMTCSYSGGSLKRTKTIGGTTYRVYQIATENASGTTRVYCLRGPQDTGTLFVCGPQSSCLVE